MKRYAGLVGAAQTEAKSYESVQAECLPAKMLLLTKDPDALMETCLERY